MRAFLSLPGYLLFLCAALRVLIYPVTRGSAWPWAPTYSWSPQPLVGMTALQAITLAVLGAAWLRWGAPMLSDKLLVLLSSRRRWQLATVLGAGVLLFGVVLALYREQPASNPT